MNILFILADQFRADCMGHIGNDVIQTPNLDQLAQEGVSFSHCFNQAAPCGPSRMCIYTSRYMCSTRAIKNFTPLRDPEENFAYVLRRNGYAPGLVGYNDYTVDPTLLPEGDERQKTLRYDNVLPGFDRIYYHEYDSEEYFDWLRDKGYPEELLNHEAIHQPNLPPGGSGEHLAQHYPAKYGREESECWYLTERAIQFIRQRSESRANQDKGWVLSLNYLKPHPPNICCEPYHRMYDPDEIPPASRRVEELEPSHKGLKLLAGRQLEDELHLREYRACYYGMISEVDDNLGRLFAFLRASGQWEDTLIIFSADHAEHLGDHYLTGKGHFYDGGLRIPYIVRDPSVRSDGTRGQIFHNLMESIDSAPTILNALGVEVPDRFQGRSVLPLLRGDGEYSAREAAFYEFDYRGSALAAEPDSDPDRHLLWVVRDKRYKYIQFADDSIPPLLFDLEADPQELHDVAGRTESREAMLACCQRLLRWRMYHEDQRMEHWAQQYR